MAGMCLFGLLLRTILSEVEPFPFHYYAFYVISVIMGGYFAHTQLCEEEEAADLSQISCQPPD
jgi:hypothetical protein